MHVYMYVCMYVHYVGARYPLSVLLLFSAGAPCLEPMYVCMYACVYIHYAREPCLESIQECMPVCMYAFVYLYTS